MRAVVSACFIVATMMLKEASGTVTSARASSNDGNVAANAIDGQVGTRWSAQGSGEWLELTMNNEYTLTGVKIAFYKGNERSSEFQIQVSTDRSSWQTAVSRRSSSGSTIWNEEFSFDVARTARYIRYVGYGNSANDWNSITKFTVVKGTATTSNSLVGSLIWLRKSGGDRLYLTAERDGNNELIARASKVGDWEKFLVEAHPSGGVAIKAMTNGQYLRVQGTSTTTEIRARTPTPGSWTQFTIQFQTSYGANRIAIKSEYNGKWLQASYRVASSLVYPSGPNPLTWETFEYGIVGAATPSVPSTPSTPTPPASTPSTPSTPSFSLNKNSPPSSNFNLKQWYLSVPSDTDNSGTADDVKENELNSGYEHSTYFYTGSDGGMVFYCPIDGYKTSTSTSYTRTELREMLRAGDTSISTSGVNENNWVLSSAPSSAQNAAGGVDGTLTATLAVNYVTRTGDDSQVGRVIVGQIHGEDDEPCRVYYRKLPGNSKGSVYFASEERGGDDEWVELIGSRDSDASNPSDGIALDEVWSYKIQTSGNTLTVTVMRDGKSDVSKSVTMKGYGVSDEYMYFKAGVYNQNNSGDDDDYVKATFYALSQTH